MLNWFSRTAAPRHPIRETVKIPYGQDPQHTLRAEMKVRFNEDGTHVYEPEASLLKLDFLNDKNEWERVPDEEVAMFKGDKAVMDALYAAALKPAEEMPAEDYEATPEEHLDSFERSTVEQIADSEKVFFVWWKGLSPQEKVDFFEGSYFMEDLAQVMADKFRKMTVQDLKADSPGIYDVLLQMYDAKHKKNKDNADTQEQRKKQREQTLEEKQKAEEAPAA